MRTQEQCKALDKEIVDLKQNHQEELKELKLEKLKVEEKYGSLLKEKNHFLEEKRVLMNTLDAIKTLGDKDRIHREKRKEKTLNVIDISDEERNGGATSAIIECKDCDYKTTTEVSLNQHKNTKHKGRENKNNKHVDNRLPCDSCEYVATNAGDFIEHTEKKHDIVIPKKKKVEEVNKKAKSSKSSNSRPDIDCDMCEYTTKNTSSFIKHVDSHQTKRSEIKPFKCDICQNKMKTADDFKKHLKEKHNKNIQENQDFKKNRSTKKCIFWNRGYCKYSSEQCTFSHEEIPECKFQERCYRYDCKFFHRQETGRFPFIQRNSYNLRSHLSSADYRNDHILWKMNHYGKNTGPYNRDQQRSNVH